jgi:hypothetical protein
MGLLAKKKFIVVDLESTYGVDPTPAQAVQTSELSITPLLGDEVGRNLDRGTLGNDLQVLVGEYVQLTFKVEMAGSGVAGQAPVYRALLLACGFGETIFPGTHVAYFPVSSDFDSIAIDFRHDGQLHKVLGARGSVAMEMDAGQIPKFVFSMTGLFVDPTSEADPTPDFSGQIRAVPMNKRNTTTFQLHGENLIMSKFGVDMACVVDYENLVGSEEVVLSDRAPVGSTSFKSVPISQKNWFTAAKDSTLGNLLCIHGTTAGNIWQVSGPQSQIRGPRYSGDKSSFTDAGLAFMPTASQNDEVSIVFT